MSPTPSHLWTEQVYEEACEWFVQFRAGTDGGAARAAFHTWLQQSPAHMGAYLEAASVWNRTASAQIPEKYTRERLIMDAALDSDNVIPLADAAGRVASVRSLGPKKRRWGIAGLAAGIAVLGFGLALYSYLSSQGLYTTGVGEQRSIALADGSVIDLNARSRVQVRYTAMRRDVRLLEGQALFKVAHDHARPFIVQAGDTRVRAVGTQFDVNRLRADLVVTVLEGRVTVGAGNLDVPPPNAAVTLQRPPASSGGASPEAQESVSVGAGEQVRVNANGKMQPPSHANLAVATAWTQRKLVFESTPLMEVVEQFNRYNARPLELDDPDLGDLQIDGVFSSTDPQPLVRFLRSRGIQIVETGRAIRVTSGQPR